MSVRCAWSRRELMCVDAATMDSTRGSRTSSVKDESVMALGSIATVTQLPRVASATAVMVPVRPK